MTLLIYSDPHLGMELKSHTTPQSRIKLRDKLCSHATEMIPKFYEDGDIVCAGDFFHKPHNCEEVIKQSLHLFHMTAILLEGNHDTPNIVDQSYTLDLLSQISRGKVEGGAVRRCGDSLYTVPHQLTQEAFEQGLEEAMRLAEEDRHLPGDKILITHCNYDREFAKDDSSLLMTRGDAEILLESFSYVILGHEHEPREDFDGRLIVVGSTHPTNFGDIGDKRIILIDDEGVVSSKTVWEQEGKYFELDVGTLNDVDLPDTANFIRIKGTVKAEQIYEVSKSIKRLWKELPNVYAIRSDVKIESPDCLETDLKTRGRVSIKERITADLEGIPSLLAMWNEVTCD